MILIDYTLKRFDWNVKVLYFNRDFNYRNIISVLEDLECPDKMINEILDYCTDCFLDCGLTYTNSYSRETTIVIFKCSSVEELYNTCIHELYHFILLLSTVEFSTEEDLASLMGDMFMKLLRELKNLVR